MSDPGTIWRRVGGFFHQFRTRPREADPGSQSAAGPVEDAGARGGPAGSADRRPGSGGDATAGAAPAGLRPLAETVRVPWWRRRQLRHAQQRDLARRVVDLAAAMREHFERQDRRAAELTQTLERIGGVLEQLAASQDGHGQRIGEVVGQTERLGQHVASISDTLGRVPEAMVQQAEALRGLSKRLEITQETDLQLMHSLQAFGRAVDTLGSSGTAQVEALRRLAEGQRGQHDAIAALVRAQNRRLLVVVAAACVVALAGVAALVVALVGRVGWG